MSLDAILSLLGFLAVTGLMIWLACLDPIPPDES